MEFSKGGILTSRRDLLVAVAKMYYIQGLSQQEISDKINLSRSNVSRLLKTCVEQKVVEFRINDTSSIGLELQNRIKRLFSLKEVLVVPTHPDPVRNKMNLGEMVVNYLEGILQMGMLLGVSWGTTMYHVSKAFRLNCETRVDVIQLVGGIGAKSIDTDGHEITKSFANALNGNAYILQAPFYVQTKLLKEMLMQEPNIAEHFRRFDQVDVALVGMGGSSPSLSAHYRAGYITRQEAQKLSDEGVVADICGIQLDRNGQVRATDITDKSIAISYEQLKRIPIVIGAATGIEKTDAILGCLHGDLIDVLVIDEAAAFAVLSREAGYTTRN